MGEPHDDARTEDARQEAQDGRAPADVCPYLGLTDDDRSHFDFPSSEHRCRSEPKRVYVELAHQGTYCLTAKHTKCFRYYGSDTAIAIGVSPSTPQGPRPNAALPPRGAFGQLVETPKGWVPVASTPAQGPRPDVPPPAGVSEAAAPAPEEAPEVAQPGQVPAPEHRMPLPPVQPVEPEPESAPAEPESAPAEPESAPAEPEPEEPAAPGDVPPAAVAVADDTLWAVAEKQAADEAGLGPAAPDHGVAAAAEVAMTATAAEADGSVEADPSSPMPSEDADAEGIGALVASGTAGETPDAGDRLSEASVDEAPSDAHDDRALLAGAATVAGVAAVGGAVAGAGESAAGSIGDRGGGGEAASDAEAAPEQEASDRVDEDAPLAAVAAAAAAATAVTAAGPESSASEDEAPATPGEGDAALAVTGAAAVAGVAPVDAGGEGAAGGPLDGVGEPGEPARSGEIPPSGGSRVREVVGRFARLVLIAVAGIALLAGLVGVGYIAGKVLVRPGEPKAIPAVTAAPSGPATPGGQPGVTSAPGTTATPDTSAGPGASAEPTAAPTAKPTPTPKPTPTAKPTPRPTPKPRVYIVRPNDTVSGLAGRFGVTMNVIIDANDLKAPYTLFVGQRLIIPRP